MGEIKTSDIEALSIERRLELIERVWGTLLETPDQVPVPEWHVEELDRRLEGLAEAPDAGSSWDDVQARIKNPK